MKIDVHETRSANECPLCQAAIDARIETKACPDCAVVYHSACLVELGGCATPGCASTRRLPIEVTPVAARVDALPDPLIGGLGDSEHLVPETDPLQVLEERVMMCAFAGTFLFPFALIAIALGWRDRHRFRGPGLAGLFVSFVALGGWTLLGLLLALGRGFN